MNRPAIIALTTGGLDLARRIAPVVDGEVHGRRGRTDDAEVEFADTAGHVVALFAAGRPVIGICAAGILIRALAPHLADKRAEPPVLALAEDGSAVVPLIGGHHGANALAREIAEALGIAPAITTASDTRLGLALDEPPAGYVLAGGDHLRDITARLVAGEPVRITGEAPWLGEARIARASDAALEILVTDLTMPATPDRLVYHPATLALGIGAERGADPLAALQLARDCLDEAGLSAGAVALVASLVLKEDEPAVHRVAEGFDRPARFFAADRLEQETPRLANPSQTVFRAVGCHGVAEAAALAAAGPGGSLAVEKRIGDRVTVAIARATAPIDPSLIGRPRGRLSIVGLGPGDLDWRTGEAGRLIAAADDLVGYGLYLDLAGPLARGQTRHDFALGEEEARVVHALDLAATGRHVALISSGDPGIYAMAALAFELIERGPAAWSRIAITVAPGISALQAAAARVGAPLGHDFCAISLSDLMTLGEVIERRLEAAAAGDFVVALYNPASRRRRALLDRALAILAAHRPPTTPVVIARNLGRPGETVEAVALGEVDPDRVDMLSVILIGASATRQFKQGDGAVRVYTPRGYGVEANTAGRRKAAS